MKFRLVLETISKNGHKAQIKFNVPPSKHLGLVNFLNIATRANKDVHFTIEKNEGEKTELSNVHGTFKFVVDETLEKSN